VGPLYDGAVYPLSVLTVYFGPVAHIETAHSAQLQTGRTTGRPDRDALFLLSKAWNTNHAPQHLRAACDATLDRLGVDRLDCYMLHWPDAWACPGPLGENPAFRPDSMIDVCPPTAPAPFCASGP